jgi:hypothetical protein
MLCGPVWSHVWWTGVTHTVADKPHECLFSAVRCEPVTRKVTQAIERVAGHALPSSSLMKSRHTNSLAAHYVGKLSA